MRNKINLIGKIQNKGKVKTYKNNVNRIHFKLRIDESYKNNDGEMIPNYSYVPLVAWNGTAKVIDKYLKNGKEVAIEARFDSSSFKDKDGSTQYVLQNVVNDIIFLESSKKVKS
ncbi:single-stranded DNA-binding protein [Lutimonas halocynthiae]|uniref:single-stranded DNA-binding protein n=1 Tax=Lutimonas halocynthiae TaxID=1446477 RepID=UPI0025B2AEA3|nr:single-stranded DNA-binding protein [Lutimonas halocynthiae]MDN3643613.1 single-stranded DNA-binding protein [Lutimonas halocynthiae]